MARPLQRWQQITRAPNDTALIGVVTLSNGAIPGARAYSQGAFTHMTIAIAEGKLEQLKEKLERIIRENFPHVTFPDVRITAKESYSGDGMVEIFAVYEGENQQLHGPERRGLLVRLQDAISDEGVDAFPNLYFSSADRSVGSGSDDADRS